MNREQKTIKKIQELVPEIMELKFGCGVVDEEYGRKHIYYFGSKTKDFVYLHKENKERQEWKNKFKDNFTILGRDITLFDIRKIFKMNNDFGSCNTVLTLWDLWNDEDNFEKQSQKCKYFIGDLILNK